MIYKLAFKNALKNLGEYGIYFLTLSLGVCIFYIFNAAFDTEVMQTANQGILAAFVNLSTLMSIMSYFTAAVLGFLILYATNFFIKNRKKEIGTYLILGMRRPQVSVIITLETVIIALISFAIGITIGVFLSQMLSLVTAGLFEVKIQEYHFVFSIRAFIKTVVYYLIIFVMAMLFNMFVIAKVRIIHLIYGGRRNEYFVARKKWITIPVFILSLACFAIAYYIYGEKILLEIEYIFWVMGLGTVGVFGFFFSVTGIMVALAEKMKRLYFKNLNIFVIKQFAGKINTNFVTLSVVSISLLLAIGIFTSANGTREVLNSEFKQKTTYDFSFLDYTPDFSSQDLPKPIRESELIQDQVEFSLSFYEKNLGQIFDGRMSENYANYDVNLMKQSDYNRLMRMLGQAEVKKELGQNYIIMAAGQLNSYLKPVVEQLDFQLEGQRLEPAAVQDLALCNNRKLLVFVIQDSYWQASESVLSIVNLKTATEKDSQALKEIILSNRERQKNWRVSIKIDNQIDGLTSKVGMLFLGIYFGLVFIITCSAILAINMLVEVANNKGRYQLLSKIGSSRAMINGAIFRQTGLYFGLPLIVALVNAYVGLRGIIKLINMIGSVNVLANILVTALFILGIYGIYFVVTYLSCLKIIKE